MFNLLLLIAWLFRAKQLNLSGSLWGLPDRRKALSILESGASTKAKAYADLKALDPMQGN